MKTIKTTWRQILSLCVIVIALSMSFQGCSKSSSSSQASGETLKTGAASFSLQWPASAYKSSNIPYQASAESITSIDCETIGVATIEASITESQGTSLGTDSWQCWEHSGTINNVLAGSDRKVVVKARDSVGNIVYHGEKPSVPMRMRHFPLNSLE